MVIWCTKHQDWFLKFITISWAIKYSFLRQSWPVSYICIASHLPITRCEMCQIFGIKCTRHITDPIAIEALLLNFYRGYWQSSDFCPKYVAWFNMISESSEITWLFFFFLPLSKRFEILPVSCYVNQEEKYDGQWLKWPAITQRFLP